MADSTLSPAAAQAASEVASLRSRVARLQADQATWQAAVTRAQEASRFCDAVAEMAEQLATDARGVARNCQLRATGQSEFADVCMIDSAVPAKVMAETAGQARSMVDLVAEGWKGESATAYGVAARSAADLLQTGSQRVASWTRSVGANAALVAQRAEEKARELRGQAVQHRRIAAARQDDIAAAHRRIGALRADIGALEAVT